MNSDPKSGTVGRLRGWQNVPLVDRGRAQAKAAGAKLASMGVTKLFSSDLQPATETASIIGKMLGLPVIKDKNLRTQDVGALTGRPTDEARKDLRQYQDKTPDKPLPSGGGFRGESLNNWYSRWSKKGFSRLAAEAEKADGPVAAVTHGHNLRSLARIVSGDPSTPIPMEGVASHGEIIQLQKRGESWKLSKI